MLTTLLADRVHYAKLSVLLWKHGRHDLAEQLGTAYPASGVTDGLQRSAGDGVSVWTGDLISHDGGKIGLLR
ncbi:hypothetical protein NZK35_02260 [Stieleria sp. ICT_E10.1]|uniref:hypothetical protein n=1 Tax=Stieleria sedimenti TaxID=2976331 RepID=UPI00217FC804|nr:hypothetical protein [Stieleria sedimenti]MCS7465491.1 hypothetical protein [Stieleria sedimenti]